VRAYTRNLHTGDFIGRWVLHMYLVSESFLYFELPQVRGVVYPDWRRIYPPSVVICDG
jgi:hypothetical protein